MTDVNIDETTRLHEVARHDLSRLVDHSDEALEVAREDIEGLIIARESYGPSWKQRGGIGAFMMLARKWDRLYQMVCDQNQAPPGDVAAHITADLDAEGEAVIDTVRDLRRYLMLVEAQMLAEGWAPERSPGQIYVNDCDNGHALFKVLTIDWRELEGNVSDAGRAERYDILSHIAYDLNRGLPDGPTLRVARSLRRELLALEARLRAVGWELPLQRDNRVAHQRGFRVSAPSD